MWTLLLGAGVEWRYQCHIRASGGRETVMSVCLDLMISPGVCTVSYGV